MPATPRALLAWLWRPVKRRLPASLFGRSLLIIVLPITIMQIAVTYVFFDAHWQTVNSHLTEGVAGDIAWVLKSYEAAPDPANLARLAERAQQTLSLSVAVQEGAVLPKGRRPSLLVAVDRSLRKALSEHIDAPFWFDTARYPAYVDIRVKIPQGVMRVIVAKDRVFATRGHIFLLWLTVATFLLTTVSILFIRNQVRAIERLAEAAEGFGRGVDVPFRPHGAREVRQAARAFLSMKARIQRHVDQRTTLLAAVSHDLRTPLTRLKLELELSEPGSQVEAMRADVAEMEHLIDEYLAFARGEGSESVETVDVRRLLEEVSAAAFRAGALTEISAEKDLTARVRPNAVKRALSNLIMNAADHAGHVAVSAEAGQAGAVRILIDDDGPGIDDERYEEAFAPFSRLDDERHPNQKGVGLGLAIARDIIRGHGGDLTLGRSPLGGLRASISLPG
jgi:two-component system osmolarity sensor histidine kinase EnvZ